MDRVLKPSRRLVESVHRHPRLEFLKLTQHQVDLQLKDCTAVAGRSSLLRRWSEYDEHEQPFRASIADTMRYAFGCDQQDSSLHGNLIAFK